MKQAKSSRFYSINFVLALVASSFVCSSFACNSQKTQSLNPTKNATSDKAELETETETKPLVSAGPNARTVCKAPSSLNNDPATIDELVTLINALPKPTSVACLIDALKGPFKINATSNPFSGQPSFSTELPRIFLKFGAKLYVAVVPKGDGGKVVEVSYRQTDTTSVKGEIHFPVAETLASDAPYTSILNSNNSSTVCGICHFPELAAGEGFPSTAFSSVLLSPNSSTIVSIAQLKQSAAKCATEIASECAVLEALFYKGTPSPFRFDDF